MQKDLYIVLTGNVFCGIYNYENLQKFMAYKYYLYKLTHFIKSENINQALNSFVSEYNVSQIDYNNFYVKKGYIHFTKLANISKKELRELSKYKYIDDNINEIPLINKDKIVNRQRHHKHSHTDSKYSFYSSRRSRHSTGWKHSTKYKHQWEVNLGR